ncbi:hypothetical protein E2C01_012959 [Portunus trituberculatus]|uniref:Uncharacterized protein n=1 Tax=Portunus trituberculatus TaxID=210409 RepID=A0A5B7DFU0_PORTR|nr:hypothetical protein [Portunus trituberculatus]
MGTSKCLVRVLRLQDRDERGPARRAGRSCWGQLRHTHLHSGSDMPLGAPSNIYIFFFLLPSAQDWYIGSRGRAAAGVLVVLCTHRNLMSVQDMPYCLWVFCVYLAIR